MEENLRNHLSMELTRTRLEVKTPLSLEDGTSTMGSAETARWSALALARLRHNGSHAWKDILRHRYYDVLAKDAGTEELENSLVSLAATALSWADALKKRRGVTSGH